MPILRNSEIRSMNTEDRNKKLSELKVELMKLRTESRAKGKLENPDALRQIKRTIARILTVQNEERLKTESKVES